jgi:GDP-4-dehydro-6-deoxy-D-mannose reductase
MRSFITGIDGFIGSWLAETLVAAGDQVYGLTRKNAGELGPITRLTGDLASAALLTDAVAEARPDRIFHLAALNNIQDSFADPRLTIETNVLGSLYLLEAVRQIAPAACFVSVGSSAEYGRTAAEYPLLSEDLPLFPSSPYGISKLTQGQFARLSGQVHGLRSIHVRPFAVVGPRKKRDALGDFCKNVAAIERGESDRFLVGNVSAERDFVDVRDCVSALIVVSEQGKAGLTYNLCNGRAASLGDILVLLQRLARRPFEPSRDASRLRTADDPRIVGDSSRIRELGYAPRFSLEDTVAATLDFWRSAVAP